MCTITDTICDHLDRRHRRGVSWYEIARGSGVSRSTVQRFAESPGHAGGASGRTIDRLARYLGLSLVRANISECTAATLPPAVPG